MNLSIYQCDKCGADCSDYDTRVTVNFPRGYTKHLCMKCAVDVFEKHEPNNQQKEKAEQ